MIERLRIMHDLAAEQNFSIIPKEELKTDLSETLTKLEAHFKDLIQ